MKPKKPNTGESLAEINPELAKQWHPTNNGKLTPCDLGPGSGKVVWWKCPKGDPYQNSGHTEQPSSMRLWEVYHHEKTY